MKDKEIIFLHDKENIAKSDFNTMRACFGNFLTYDDDDKYLIFLLEDMLSDESISIEMSSIIFGSDPEGLEEEFIDESDNSKVIVMNYDKSYIVLPEKIAAQFIID